MVSEYYFEWLAEKTWKPQSHLKLGNGENNIEVIFITALTFAFACRSTATQCYRIINYVLGGFALNVNAKLMVSEYYFEWLAEKTWKPQSHLKQADENINVHRRTL